ncbi:hypothetical protein ACFW1A_20495 [Kitasatospora sp. NPDC058965]|uniref:hypothetical protein n=1 Tax=Kitasatospora sp. NPDC058965 TaxID=3346682 RepID=UPI0036884438
MDQDKKYAYRILIGLKTGQTVLPTETQVGKALKAMGVTSYSFTKITDPERDRIGLDVSLNENRFVTAIGTATGVTDPGSRWTFKFDPTGEQQGGPGAVRGEFVNHLTLPAVGATEYAVTVTLSDATRKELNDNGYSIFGFKAVESSQKGKPLVWFTDTNFQHDFVLSWQVDYVGYISTTVDIDDKSHITKDTQTPMTLGERWNVPYSKDTVVGDPGSIEIANVTGVRYTCGIGQAATAGSPGAAPPICAFPLFGTGMVGIVPIEKVVLTFATSKLNTGTVIEQAFAPSLLIDLTGVSKREVSFDMDHGWGASDGGSWPTWATKLGFASDLVGPLVVGS